MIVPDFFSFFFLHILIFYKNSMHWAGKALLVRSYCDRTFGVFRAPLLVFPPIKQFYHFTRNAKR